MTSREKFLGNAQESAAARKMLEILGWKFNDQEFVAKNNNRCVVWRNYPIVDIFYECAEDQFYPHIGTWLTITESKLFMEYFNIKEGE